ncbi:MAG: hypothetical protein A2653_02305 [Candidatus Zambryskibacteria bacterium RIFCSPHIGHO2_01_FULL_43_25]|uniref:Uncharacterized protein n=1 Tax=Candidatus Zambryskibacteria bacterium RIFCSPLOWO2_01_FULL_45_21 TaxID=1802761 RepID=A0A1G2U4Z2_9BACT|nr:MAG: hypothetical protein A2653_02305 [Candidatus Zambryskibacteria bacterium RIFCSPHIGHO2_01_FULL_43_25]OHB01033.1 MAG: hypothetical protein A3E94_02485 [Candidatus Zambryskibacteria bacterium RIFCSPHIGHO2_12_FULL_44_12b]OHB03922.1 MAG: hypothetical protein A3B14_01145 [Candidatus Zambryskibacteria bacterium RIFCSPLOWO2_01_FULL_45_21]
MARKKKTQPPKYYVEPIPLEGSPVNSWLAERLDAEKDTLSAYDAQGIHHNVWVCDLETMRLLKFIAESRAREGWSYEVFNMMDDGRLKKIRGEYRVKQPRRGVFFPAPTHS